MYYMRGRLNQVDMRGHRRQIQCPRAVGKIYMHAQPYHGQEGMLFLHASPKMLGMFKMAIYSYNRELAYSNMNVWLVQMCEYLIYFQLLHEFEELR